MSQDDQSHRPLRIRLEKMEIHCPGCGELHIVGEESPREVFDPDLNRFVCPTCLEVTTC